MSLLGLMLFVPAPLALLSLLLVAEGVAGEGCALAMSRSKSAIVIDDVDDDEEEEEDEGGDAAGVAMGVDVPDVRVLSLVGDPKVDELVPAAAPVEDM